MISHALLDLGPSGSGKSHLAYTALRYYGNGIVIMARGDDEKNSYYPLYEDTEHYDFQGFDDPDFQLVLKERNAHGFADAIRYLDATYKRLRAEYDELGRVESRKVLVMDTGTAFGDLAKNAALAKFGYDEPPPAVGERGFPFYDYIRSLQHGIFAKMRAIRGLGLHWIVLAQAVERDVMENQAVKNEGAMKKQILPAFPGSFRDTVSQAFDLVVQSVVVPVAGKEPQHSIIWLPDPKRQTKSRMGSLGKANLPNDWTVLLPILDELAILRVSQNSSPTTKEK